MTGSEFHTWELTEDGLTITCTTACTIDHANPSPLFIARPKTCDHCAQPLRTGMPDGSEFGWVHDNGGTRRCPDGSGNHAEHLGTTGKAYAQ